MSTQNATLVRPSEMASMLGVSKSVLLTTVKRKKIPHVRLNKRVIRFDAKAVLNFLQKGGK